MPTRRATARVGWIVASALIGSIALVASIRAVAPRFEFPTYRITRSSVVAPDAERRIARARDGVPVEMLAFEGPREAPVVVHFHTNRQTLADTVWLGRALRARGLGALMVEYRGYGSASDASPTEDGVYADAEAALDDLEARGVPRSRIVLFGNSIGTGVAAEMARRGRGAALILMAPFTSIADLVEDAVPLAPARLLVGDAFDTLAKAAEIRVPTLVVNGDADEIVPFAMGRRIAASIAHARLVTIAGGHHGDLFVRARDRVLGEISGWAMRSERGVREADLLR